MNREKEIEEMALILYTPRYEEETDTLSGYEEEYTYKKAEALYAAGYRKAAEVKREAIKEFSEKLLEEAVESCDMYTCGMVVTVSAIEKLVKEYLG